MNTLLLVILGVTCPPDTDTVGYIKQQSWWGEMCSGYFKQTPPPQDGNLINSSGIVPTGCFAIYSAGSEMFRVCEDGAFIVRGKHITEDREMYRLLKAVLNGVCQGDCCKRQEEGKR